MSRCVIIGAGEFSEQFLKIQKDDFVIAADGGFDYLKAQNIRPDIWLGDMDSTAQKETGIEGVEYMKLPKEKDDTDTLAAIKYGLAEGYTDFSLHGMLGGRLDHTFANVQCLQYLRQHSAKGILYGRDTIVFVLENEKVTFDATLRGMISVFALGDRAEKVTECGLYYSVEDAILETNFPIGVSNEFTGTASSIAVGKGKLLLCIIPDLKEQRIDFENLMRLEKV